MRSEEISERLNSGSPWAMYAICRTKPWKELLDISFNERLGHKDAHELLVRELSRLMLRSKVIDHLTSVRQFTIPGSNLPEGTSLSEWLNTELTLNSCAAIRSRLNRGLTYDRPDFDPIKASEIINLIISKYRFTSSKGRNVAIKSKKSLRATAMRLFSRLPHVVKIVFFLVMKPQISIQGSRHSFWLFCLLLKRAHIPFVREEIAIIDKIVSGSGNNVSLRS
jgi:hypothetical protein